MKKKISKQEILAPNPKSDLPQQKSLMYHVDNQAFSVFKQRRERDSNPR